MQASLASPNWPAEHRGGERLRRFGVLHFVLLSLLVHALTLLLKFDFRPIFPVDRGRSNLSVELPPIGQIPPGPAAREPTGAARKSAVDNTGNRPTTIYPSPATMPERVQMHPSPTAIDATDLIERSKAELNAASRRQMLDPMFAPAAPHAPAKTPLERATARAETKIEELGPSLFRVTHADGSRYCLQRLPEIATRDIPVPLVGVPMKCQ